ncbi:5-formyltetrahydrofolate cyclo-ligase [Saccharospirillum impatiens]|uniref:5-formyltetrahydrofolate cyclo-ligase n=1 Tax=Saccharospirillum impatiens TaxID=169438 RepID=UPI0004008B40|nr:5-formyltetrahydrofolate cyclo-ligase [Saccharospirillum impatiens]
MTQPDPDVARQKRALRKELRARRRALSSTEQRLAAEGLIRQIRHHPDYPRARRIALYCANDGEINLEPLVRQLKADQKALFLPVLNPLDPVRPHLWFCHWQPGERMRANRFGIPEPTRPERIPTWTLDWVLMPLVGFDASGGRLGMGGGFYDRTFAHEQHWPQQPQRLGVAHECQRVGVIPQEEWDLPLAAVMTDQRVYK